MILAKFCVHDLHINARALNHARWSGPTRDWSPAAPVALNPDRESVVSAHLSMANKQPLAASPEALEPRQLSNPIPT